MVPQQTSKDLFSKVAMILNRFKSSIDLKQLFRYPYLPLSIAEPDGTLKKTAKPLLMHKLELDIEHVQAINMNHTLTADDMAYIW